MWWWGRPVIRNTFWLRVSGTIFSELYSLRRVVKQQKSWLLRTVPNPQILCNILHWAWTREGRTFSVPCSAYKRILFVTKFARKSSRTISPWSRLFFAAPKCGCQKIFCWYLQNIQTNFDPSRKKMSVCLFTTCSILIYSVQVCLSMETHVAQLVNGYTPFAITVGTFCVLSSDWQFICIVVSVDCVLGAQHSDEFANSVSMLNGLWMR